MNRSLKISQITHVKLVYEVACWTLKPRRVVLFPPRVTFCYQIFCFHVVKPLMPILALFQMLCTSEKPEYKKDVLSQIMYQTLKDQASVWSTSKFSL